LGHGHPRIKAAVAKQLDQVAYCHSFFFGTQGAENLAKELVDGTGGIMKRVFVVGSGRFDVSSVVRELRRDLEI
jgi:adenosylmethionine-8-amino-7-oxononanoate aminotransferase